MLREWAEADPGAMNTIIHYSWPVGGQQCFMEALWRQESVPLRFSFSKYNTIEEVDLVVAMIEELLVDWFRLDMPHSPTTLA
jgi:selenocysteine lyase/cysteine desulfurase